MRTAWAEIQRLRQELKDEKQVGAERSEWLLKLVMQAAEDAGDKKKKADGEAHIGRQVLQEGRWGVRWDCEKEDTHRQG